MTKIKSPGRVSGARVREREGEEEVADGRLTLDAVQKEHCVGRLGDQTRRNVGGEIPDYRKADHGSGKAANQNV